MLGQHGLPKMTQEPTEVPLKPDYRTARPKAGFAWHVGVAPGAQMALAGVPIRDCFPDPAACIEVCRKGCPLAREVFEMDLICLGGSTPAISYGHVNGLASALIFIGGGEVAHAPTSGNTVDILELGSIAGAFATINRPSAQWTTNSPYRSGILAYSAIPETGPCLEEGEIRDERRYDFNSFALP